MIEEFASVEVDGWEVYVFGPDEVEITEGIDRLVDPDDDPLSRLRAEQSRERVRALVEEALGRPAYGSFEGDGRFRLLPGDPGHPTAALLSLPGAHR